MGEHSTLLNKMPNTQGLMEITKFQRIQKKHLNSIDQAT